MDYLTINRYSWREILSECGLKMQPPVTVHLPIQPLHSPDLIHVDAALNVCRRRVFSRLSMTNGDEYEATKSKEPLIVTFAFDDPPFIPDFRNSSLSLAEGKYPIVKGSYFAWDLSYELEYFCVSVDERQALLWICGEVTNEGEKTQQAHIRAKVNFQQEKDIFDYHYVPFHWDITKWLPCDLVHLRGDLILRDSSIIGKVMPGGFEVKWEDYIRFNEEDFNKKFSCETPYFVNSNMRLKDVSNVIHFQNELVPGEKKNFALAILTNYENIQDSHRTFLINSNPCVDRQSALRKFESHVSGETTQMLFSHGSWDKIFTELQLSTLGLLIELPGETGLMPTQGGSSERHFVWVWEAVCMLMPMLKLGHFKPLRKAIEYIFSLQDAGCPPEGRFTTTLGAIGTTGPKWMNSTGSALALAADYYRYSQDNGFLATYLPKILKASQWIVGELRATRKLNPDGSRPLYFGLMPFGHATDGDIGYIVAFTDAYTFWGLEKTVLLLERIRHERADEFRKELELYRLDLAKAIKGMTREDGYIERKILTGQETLITAKFEGICSAIHLAYTGAMDVRTEAFQKFMTYFEERMADSFFLGKMDRDVVYIGTGEFPWQQAYLALGEWKKAFLAAQTNLNYGMTQDTFQVQERFHKRNPAFTPWQPNGSGNGRMLQMILNSIYFEDEGTATIFAGVPFAWLVDNKVTRLKNFYTTRGRVTLEGIMQENCICRLELSSDNTGVLPPIIRFPSHFIVRCDMAGIEKIEDDSFRILKQQSKSHFIFMLEENKDA
jgi:hypothetical protein